MANRPKKRSLNVAGHSTSVSLEDDFWDALNEMARARGHSVPNIVAEIDSARGSRGLSSAIRSAVLAFYQSQARANNKQDKQ